MIQQVQVSNEIGELKKVIIHRPDEGISRISPKRSAELLFDDIVHLPLMQKEHDIFKKVLHAFVGQENVLEVEDLLLTSLSANEIEKNKLIEWVVQHEELPTSMLHLFKVSFGIFFKRCNIEVGSSSCCTTHSINLFFSISLADSEVNSKSSTSKTFS